MRARRQSRLIFQKYSNICGCPSAFTSIIVHIFKSPNADLQWGPPPKMHVSTALFGVRKGSLQTLQVYIGKHTRGAVMIAYRKGDELLGIN